MAVAKCGMLWNWASPMWCSGKINKGEKNEKVNKMCYCCPWWKGNKKDYD